jgi:hypothetical protein
MGKRPTSPADRQVTAAPFGRAADRRVTAAPFGRAADRRVTAAPFGRAADRAYERVREICLGFPAAEEKLSHGAPAFHVRGKMFLTFADDHHGDGRIAVWCKASPDEQRRLVGDQPDRYFVPPYVGVKGWVGVRVDGESPDWVDLSMLVEEAWRSVAPARVLRGEDVQPAGARPPPSPRVTTDAKVARAALERLTEICLALPDAVCERESRHATFRVRKKTFAYFLDNHHGDGAIAACIKGDKRQNSTLVRQESSRFFSPAYIGARGWLGVRLDTGRVDWKDVASRVEVSYRAVAPKALTLSLGKR